MISRGETMRDLLLGVVPFLVIGVLTLVAAFGSSENNPDGFA